MYYFNYLYIFKMNQLINQLMNININFIYDELKIKKRLFYVHLQFQKQLHFQKPLVSLPPLLESGSFVVIICYLCILFITYLIQIPISAIRWTPYCKYRLAWLKQQPWLRLIRPRIYVFIILCIILNGHFEKKKLKLIT